MSEMNVTSDTLILGVDICFNESNIIRIIFNKYLN